MASEEESTTMYQSVPSVDRGIAPSDTNRKTGESGSDDNVTGLLDFHGNRNMFVASSSSSTQSDTTSSGSPQDQGQRPTTTTTDVPSNSERHPREWDSDQVLRWFRSNKLDDLYKSLFYRGEPKDGAALDKIFNLKLRNYERYRAYYTERLPPDQNNLLKDFDQFGQLLDNCFIDKYAYRFDVAFSFPGEIREQVSRIADKLCVKINTKEGEQRVFYDNYHKVELARPNLDLYLQSIYRYQSRLIVVFMCAPYKIKEWCGLEERAIRGLLKANQSSRIMLLTVDGETINGFTDIDGYWDIRNENEDHVVDGIYQRFKALGEPVPWLQSLRPALPEKIISKMIVATKNAFRSISPWYIVVALSSYIFGTLSSR